MDTPTKHGRRTAGAGRKKNTPNKASSERADKARKSGQMPSEGMLSLGRLCEAICAAYRPRFTKEDGRTGIEWSKEERDEFKEFVKLASDCYGKAAPYFEQKFASVTVLRHLDLSSLSDEELDVLEATWDRISRHAESDPHREGDPTRH